MTFASTVPTFLSWVRSAQVSADSWRDVYEAAHPSIFDVHYQSWGDPSRGAQTAASAAKIASGLAAAEQRARRTVAETAAVLKPKASYQDAILPMALIVGVGTSNGWVAPLDGELTLSLALEMLPSPPYDKVLVAHEAIHLVHHQLRPDPWPETVATRLYGEA